MVEYEPVINELSEAAPSLPGFLASLLATPSLCPTSESQLRCSAVPF